MFIDIRDILFNCFESWGYIYNSHLKTVYVHKNNMQYLKDLLKDNGINDIKVLQGFLKKWTR
jgi:hypothetical protein